MRRLIVVLALAAAAGGPAALAQTAAPDSENGRYSFNQVADGLLRLDTRTGQVSLCAKKETGFACNTVPDERTALENEIARLQRENGTLKKAMLAHNLPLPGGIARRAVRRAAARAEPEGAAAERCRNRSRDERIREDVAPPRRHGAEDAEQRQDLNAAYRYCARNFTIRATASSRWRNGTLRNPWQAPG